MCARLVPTVVGCNIVTVRDRLTQSSVTLWEKNLDFNLRFYIFFKYETVKRLYFILLYRISFVTNIVPLPITKFATESSSL